MQRQVRGDPQIVYMPTNTADVINPGDMLVVSSGTARPVSTQTTGAAAAQIFLGVAQESKPSGSTASISIATGGEHVFLVSGTLAVGDRVKPHTSGGAAVVDTVAASATGEFCIGRVVELLSGGRARVRIFSLLDRQHQAAAS